MPAVSYRVGVRNGNGGGDVNRHLLTAILLVIAILALCGLACDNGPEWDAWQAEVQQRQRDGLATSTPTAEVGR